MSSHQIVLVATLFLSVSIRFGESESSLFKHYGFPQSPSPRSQDFGQVLTLGGESSEEDELPNFANSFSLPRIDRNVIRLGPKCETKFQRFDPITQSCFDIGAKGPCDPLMIFTGNENLHPEDKVYGHCECDRGRYDRPMVSVRGQCHFLYSQAICEVGHILLMESTKYGLQPVCRLNPCITPGKYATTTNELVPFQGQCVKLDAPSILCPIRNDVISFTKDSLDPVCTKAKASRRLFRRQITKTNNLPCREGYGKAKAGSRRCYRLLKISSR